MSRRCSASKAPVTVTEVNVAPALHSAVASTEDNLASRIAYPDLSILPDISNSSNNHGITMYAVASASSGQTVELVNTVAKSEFVSQIPTDYYCHDCNLTFSEANSFLDHVSRGHQQQQHQAIQGQDRDQNNLVEVGKMVLRCNYCAAIFERRQTLIDHIQAMHQRPSQQAQQVLVASDPEATHHLHFSSGQTLVQVQPTLPGQILVSPESAAPLPFSGNGDGLFCPDCRNAFANKYSLMKHLRSTRCRHDNDTEINKIINDQLTCGRCLKQFGSISALKKHLDAKKCSATDLGRLVAMDEVTQQIATQTNPMVYTFDVKPPTPPVKGLIFDESIQLQPFATVTVYKCPQTSCGKPCVTLRAFKMHAKCVHKGIELEPSVEETTANFICKVRGCGKLFVEELQLDVHFKHHENYIPRTGKHKCDLCHEAFYQKDMLKKHVLSFHEEVTPFKGRMKKYSLLKAKSSGKNGVATTCLREDSGDVKEATGGEVELKYDSELSLVPGTMMTIYKCPICNKRSCTDVKSFKLHCLHIHQDKNINPISEQVEAKFLCQVVGCGKLYLEQKQFDIHQRHHKSYVPSKGRYFKCDHCDSKFNTQANLDVHLIQSHMSDGQITGSADGKNDLIYEDIILEPGTMMTVYHCPVVDCNKKNYLDAKSVKTHCRRHHGPTVEVNAVPSQAEARYVCQVKGCRKLFMEQLQIDAHLKHHRNYVPTNGVFDCKCCSETFSRREHLDRHILSAHTLQRSFNDVSYLVLHRDSRQLPIDSNEANQGRVYNLPKVVGYQCSLCMKKFLHLGGFCNHVNNAHQAPGLAAIEVELKPRYSCKHQGCNRRFLTKSLYRAHLDRHKRGKGKKAMNCFKCGRNFSQFKSLYQHVIQTHADITSEEMAELEAGHSKCPVCPAVLRSAAIMKIHLRKHKGEIKVEEDTSMAHPDSLQPSI